MADFRGYQTFKELNLLDPNLLLKAEKVLWFSVNGGMRSVKLIKLKKGGRDDIFLKDVIFREIATTF